MKYLNLVIFVIVFNQTQAQKPDKYAACCGAEPIEYLHSDMSIYVPNVFTPNKDGINDLFYPFISGKVVEIIDFTVFTDVGDTVLFYRPTVVYSNLENYGWDGMRKDGLPYIGAFKYSLIMVNRQGDTRVLTGRACRIECGADADEIKQKSGCYFPEQAGPDGKVDRTKGNKEKKCE
ncbi:MAG TPA: gliding motility-associated C-terminal domain-containing protein [Saprospiraceae bacterium]|nr:gliding motility-associated C-terminal domain-containing protein [Saprospiraceae bacterium]HNT19171.1 gliding motility-associated C-terminal domain-containing protein [Saprospiraceae bacterium]